MSNPVDSENDERVFAALRHYYDLRDRGERFSSDEFLAKFPAIREKLRDFLDGAECVDRLARGEGDVSVFPEIISARVPVMVGDYEIERELGHGGMGVVYQAHHRAAKRRVALKMIRLERLATAEHRHRFQIEIQAAAALDHPHIVPIYEVGEFEGRPYFTMKLLDGGTLSEQLATFRKDPRGAARVMFTIARALDEAHSRGILHRDVKPQNIVLNAAGQAFLTDFGLAKLRDGDLALTNSAATIGSPHYMAPEQAAGKSKEVTTSADVYGLGATLYALLTGRPPFQSDSLFELLHLIQTAEPTPPRMLNSAVPVDLEVICLKCLRKERSERYATAREVADDLQSFLHGLPIRARAVSHLRRLRLWCRRNRSIAALSVLLACALLAGTVTSTVFWRVSESRLGETIVQKNRAESGYRLSREALDQSVKLIIEDPRLKKGPLEKLQLEVLSAQLEFHKRFVGENGDDPTYAADLAQCHVTMGHLANGMGEQDLALTHFREAVNVYEPLIRDAAGLRRFGNNVATSWNQIACILYDRRKRSDADVEEAFEKARRIVDRIMAASGEDADTLLHLAETLKNLGNIRRNTGHHGAAVELHRQAVNAARSALRRSGSFWSQASLAVALGELCYSHERAQELDDALSAARESVTLYEQALKERPDETDWLSGLAYAHLSLASIFSSRNLEASEAEYRNGIRVWKQLVRDHPDVVGFRVRLAESLGYFGDCLRVRERLTDAETAYADSLRTIREIEHPGTEATTARQVTGYALFGLGRTRAATKRSEEAIANLREAANVYGELVTQFPEMSAPIEVLVQIYGAMADLFAGLNQLDGSVKALERTVDYRRSLVRLSPNNAAYSQALAETQSRLAKVSSSPERRDQAVQARQQEVLALEEAAKSSNPQTALGAKWKLANLYRDIREFDKAEQAFRDCAEMWRSRLASEPGNPEVKRRLERVLKELEVTREARRNSAAATNSAPVRTASSDGEHPGKASADIP